MTPNTALHSRLRFHQLTIAVAVAENGTIHRAADVLNMTQPAATKALRELETALGVTLFTRSRRGMTLTDAGTRFLHHARAILERLRLSLDEIEAEESGLAGRVVVGMLPTAAPALLPQTVTALHQERPDIDVHLFEGTNERLIPRLMRGDLDMMVGRLPAVSRKDHLVQEVLYDEPLAIVCRPGHPLTKAKPVTLSDLANVGWIMPEAGTALWMDVVTTFSRAGLGLPEGKIESASIQANRTLLQTSDLVTVFPFQVARAEQRRGLMEILPISVETRLTPVGLTTRERSIMSPAATAVMEVLRQTAQSMRS